MLAFNHVASGVHRHSVVFNRPPYVTTLIMVAATALLSSSAATAFDTAAAADPVWPNVCENSTTREGWSQTRCPADATCCHSIFSGSSQGCCPGANSVCCGNGLTCCPEGTVCHDYIAPGWPSWAVVTTCLPAAHGAIAKPANLTTAASVSAVESVGGGSGVHSIATNAIAGKSLGKSICKPGPDHAPDTRRKNVLIIGDSVSIGYTPHVATALEELAFVQHAPSGGDGGAEETAYGVQCLDYFLRAPNGTSWSPDVVMFNWGLHDGPQLFAEPPANVTIPGQEGNMTVYASQLDAIATRLSTWASTRGTKLLFGITSPMICNLRADQDVQWLNVQAAAIMARHKIATVDLHAAVVGKCGPAPQPSCASFGEGCFCPHCSDPGYSWIANSTIAPAIAKLL